MSTSTLLPFQPGSMTPAQLAAVSYLARYSGHTHSLYAYQLRRWFAWCETGGLDPLIGIQRAHVELYIRHLGECGLMPSSVNTMMMHGVRQIEWDDPTEAIPAFLTIVLMPLSVSITDGIAFGFISYSVLKPAAGRAREVHWLVYLFAVLFLARYALLGA